MRRHAAQELNRMTVACADELGRRVAIIAAVAAVFAPITGMLLVALARGPVQGVVDPINAIASSMLFTIIALSFLSVPAALVAALEAMAILALMRQGFSRRVLLPIGAIVGAGAGIIVAPLPLFLVAEIVRNGPRWNPYATGALINGTLWGLGIAHYLVPVRARMARATDADD